MRVVFLDGYNLMHRSRYGFVTGEYSVIFNFFRSLRSLVEKFRPNKVYFVLEGRPKHRFDIFPEYKENRRVGLTPDKLEEYEKFREQRTVIEDLVENFPIETVFHPDYECDDVIAELIKEHPDDECIVISNDTDFIQLYNKYTNVSIYSPVKKEFLFPTEYDYVSWKALVGDSSDNISGVPRVGKKTASKILKNESSLKEWIDSSSPDKVKIFERNVELIRFADMSDSLSDTVRRPGIKNWSYVKSKFEDFEFDSIIRNSYWEKFVNTFNGIEIWE